MYLRWTQQRRRECIEISIISILALCWATSTGSSGADPLDSERGHPSFLAIKDFNSASIQDVARLYDQASVISDVAYLLFAAAEPLSKAPGSSDAVLPYLEPSILRLYVMRPERCSSQLAEDLYGLATNLMRTGAPKGCQYQLYDALVATFAWVRDNVALRLYDVPGLPVASAAWPDPEVCTSLDLSATVRDALQQGSTLGGTGAAVESACGIGRARFAALIPQISAALAGLHSDLPLLQQILERQAHHWGQSEGGADDDEDLASLLLSGDADRQPGSEGSRRRLARRRSIRGEVRESRGEDTRPRLQQLTGYDGPQTGGAYVGNEGGSTTGSSGYYQGTARRGLASLAVNNSYRLWPVEEGFVVAPPASMPAVLVPLVFHIMMYNTSNDTLGPYKYEKSPTYVHQMVHYVNKMAKPTNFQFFVKEVRNNPNQHPALVLDSRETWLATPPSHCTSGVCLSDRDFVAGLVTDFPRSINVFVSSDSTGPSHYLGYGWIPGSDLIPAFGVVWVSWDMVVVGEEAAPEVQFTQGSWILLHELFHHLGLRHTFGYSSVDSCKDEDYVGDTPSTFSSVSLSSFYATATSYCTELFRGKLRANWEVVEERWSAKLGIPEEDMNSWADSCPNMAGYDELGNYMTYNRAVCFAALGHFTTGQAQRAHYVTSELNPLLYAWGQYYARNASPPPPPPQLNVCKITVGGCPCARPSWAVGLQSFCGRRDNSSLLPSYNTTQGVNGTMSSSSLWCQVEDPGACKECSNGDAEACVVECAGTPQQCAVPASPAVGTSFQSSPNPPSPPPMPPPPPPLPKPMANCTRSVDGCACRPLWMFSGTLWRYCADPNSSGRLWCIVTPECPSFFEDPFRWCDMSLTAQMCGVAQVYISTSRTTPSPPAPSGRPPPPLTAPPGALPPPHPVSSPAPPRPPHPAPHLPSPRPSPLAPRPHPRPPTPSPPRPAPSRPRPNPPNPSPPLPRPPTPPLRSPRPAPTPPRPRPPSPIQSPPTSPLPIATPLDPSPPGQPPLPGAPSNLLPPLTPPHSSPPHSSPPSYPHSSSPPPVYSPSTPRPLHPPSSSPLALPQSPPSPPPVDPVPSNPPPLNAPSVPPPLHPPLTPPPLNPPSTPPPLNPPSSHRPPPLYPPPSNPPPLRAPPSMSPPPYPLPSSSAPLVIPSHPPPPPIAPPPPPYTGWAPPSPIPPPPYPPPTSLEPPLRPPPSAGDNDTATVAEIQGTVTIAADCSLLSVASRQAALKTDLQAELANAFEVPERHVAVPGLACGSIVADYTVTFPAGVDARKIEAAYAATTTTRIQAGREFTERWGPITSSTGKITALEASSVCQPGAAASPLCPPPPPSPPPPVRAAAPATSPTLEAAPTASSPSVGDSPAGSAPPEPVSAPPSDSSNSTTIIIAVVVSIGGAILLAAVIGTIYVVRRKRRKALEVTAIMERRQANPLADVIGQRGEGV